MANQELNADLQAAIYEIQQYLVDRIPPLTAYDSFELLMTQPPQFLMREVWNWCAQQSRVQAASMSDLLYHALKKIHLFISLKLVDRAAAEPYFDRLMRMALEACPPEERELLKNSLVAMRDTRNMTVTAVDLGKQQGAAGPVGPPPPTTGKVADLVSRSAHRLSLVIDRLSRRMPSAPESSADGSPSEPAAALPPPRAELVTMAAASAKSEEDLQNYIDSLKPYIGETKTEELFNVLATSLPAWDILIPPEVGAKAPAPVEAMHKIISLTKNPQETQKRFRDLLSTAVEQFNSGSLSAASAMLDLADTIAVEKKIDPSSVERLRTDLVQAINAEQLRRYSENKSKHPLLRKFMSSFPTMTIMSLLQQLRGEERPEKRRSLLGLLEAYGTEARDASLNELETELKRPTAEIDTYYLRNVIYLLHRIPRDSEATLDKELDLLTKASSRGQSIYVIKEAVIPIGQMKSDAAVKLLTLRLAEFEAALLKKETTQYPLAEMQKLLDRIVANLARIGTPAALLTVARHGMKPNPLLGDSRARLATLAQHDLSFDEETVNVLVKTIREDLPTKILGRIVPKRQSPIKLIEALSSTRSENVESLFREIAERFPDLDVGRAAAAGLERVEAPTSPSGSQGFATLTGDLQFFGLPSLMQSLSETQATGVVTLNAKDTRQTAGKLLFVGGKFVDAQAAHLRGSDALYQLLEKPVVGTFAFVPQPAESVRNPARHDVMPLIFEGIRRHDELKQISVMVPDDAKLKAGGTKPTPDPEESDPAIVREVWMKASAGERVKVWEPQITADAYRIRRLVARWIEEGALQQA